MSPITVSPFLLLFFFIENLPPTTGCDRGGYIARDSIGISHANIINNGFNSCLSTAISAFACGNASCNGYVLGYCYDANYSGALDRMLTSPISTDYVGMALVSSRFPYLALAKLLTTSQALTQAINSVGASLVQML